MSIFSSFFRVPERRPTFPSAEQLLQSGVEICQDLHARANCGYYLKMQQILQADKQLIQKVSGELRTAKKKSEALNYENPKNIWSAIEESLNLGFMRVLFEKWVSEVVYMFGFEIQELRKQRRGVEMEKVGKYLPFVHSGYANKIHAMKAFGFLKGELARQAELYDGLGLSIFREFVAAMRKKGILYESGVIRDRVVHWMTTHKKFAQIHGIFMVYAEEVAICSELRRLPQQSMEQAPMHHRIVEHMAAMLETSLKLTAPYSQVFQKSILLVARLKQSYLIEEKLNLMLQIPKAINEDVEREQVQQNGKAILNEEESKMPEVMGLLFLCEHPLIRDTLKYVCSVMLYSREGASEESIDASGLGELEEDLKNYISEHLLKIDDVDRAYAQLAAFINAITEMQAIYEKIVQ